MCDCVEQINNLLEKGGENTRIPIPITFMNDMKEAKGSCVKILTEKIDSNNRAKAKTIFSSYCPFCGEKHE